jgi:hypothetical protein
MKESNQTANRHLAEKIEIGKQKKLRQPTREKNLCESLNEDTS